MFLGVLELPLILLVVLVVLVLAGKNEPDERRERPVALYLSFVTLVGVLVLFAATFVTAHGLMELTNTTPSGGWSSYPGPAVRPLVPGRGDRFIPPGQVKRLSPRLQYGTRPSANHDDDVSEVVGGLIAAAVALALLWFHAPRLQGIADDSVGPGARIYARLLYVISGAALLTGLAAAASSLYSVYGMVAPDTAGAGAATDALRAFVSTAALAAVAALVFRTAWRRADDLAAVTRVVTVVEPAPPVKKAARVRRAAPPPE